MKPKAKSAFDKVLSLLNNRVVWIGATCVVAMLLMKQCRESEAAKAEALRQHNNFLASQDSVRLVYQDKEKVVFEKSALELKVSEFGKEQKDLIKQLELAKNGKSTTPKTVIQYVTVYKDSFINVASTITKDSNGQESISFSHEPQLPGKNKLKISGKVPYELSVVKDVDNPTEYTASIKSGSVTLGIEQNIDIVTGIYRDPKTKRIMTRISTTYPNLQFSDMNSFDVTDNPDTRALMKKSRKEFGIGATIGWGFAPGSMKPGPMVGVGLHYTPKFLQFGK